MYFSTNNLVFDRNPHVWSESQQEIHDQIKTLHDEGVFDEKSFLKIIANSKVGEKYFLNIETEIPKALIDFAKRNIK